MDITAIAPWFGSKRILAPQIVRQLGPHRSYWEPFCGSMAVLLAKPECSQETVNDLHGDLINLARVLREQELAVQLYARLARTLVHEGLFRECSGRLRSECPTGDPDAQRAYDFFISSWLGRNGVIGTKQYNNGFCVRYTATGGIQGTRFRSAVESIPAWHERLREVTILQRDAFTLLERIEDQAGTAIYVDPPYLRETRGRNASKGWKSGAAVYIHDFDTDEQHVRLAHLLRRFRSARVVVSYYAHERLAELYPGWTQILRPVAKGLTVQGRRGSKGEKAPEVMLVNGPAFAALEGPDLYAAEKE